MRVAGGNRHADVEFPLVHEVEEVRRLSGRHHPDSVLLYIIVILCAVGIVTVYSASAASALHLGLPADHYAVRQLVATLIGLVCMFGFSYVRYDFWYRWAPRLMAVNIGLLFLVLVIGVKDYGGRRWLGFGSHTFQPSEFTLLITALYLAFLFSKKLGLLYSFRRGVLPVLLVTGLNFALIILEPDMGTALTVFGVALMVTIAAGVRIKHIAWVMAGVVPLIVGLAMSSYRVKRLLAFARPFNHPTSAYQLLQGMTGITAGGWLGRGFGMSIEKTGYLPFPQTDFIFPVFVEEWGLVGAIALLAIFAVLLWRGFTIARYAKDRFGAILAVGLTGIIAVGTFINLGAVTGLLPVTGIPLPFISYGGTSLIISLTAMGILLSVSRDTLETAPASDELADVIDVSAMRERALPRPQRPARRKLPPPRPPERRIAEVRSLTSQRVAGSEHAASWRARQEAAAARTSTRAGGKSAGSRAGSGSERAPAATGSARNWRDRNGSSAATRGHAGADATRRRKSRKD